MQEESNFKANMVRGDYLAKTGHHAHCSSQSHIIGSIEHSKLADPSSLTTCRVTNYTHAGGVSS